jgi:hypothetical protein
MDEFTYAKSLEKTVFKYKDMWITMDCRGPSLSYQMPNIKKCEINKWYWGEYSIEYKLESVVSKPIRIGEMLYIYLNDDNVFVSGNGNFVKTDLMDLLMEIVWYQEKTLPLSKVNY